MLKKLKNRKQIHTDKPTYIDGEIQLFQLNVGFNLLNRGKAQLIK